MTFKRNFLMQISFPFIAISFVGLLAFTFWLPIPPLFSIWYGIAIIVVSSILLFKALQAAKLTDFEYTISYNDSYLKIEMANGETHVYNRNSLKAGIEPTYFWLDDGTNSHTYSYTKEVIQFLDQL